MSTNTYYQYCAVPMCKNNPRASPNKLFISVPTNQNMRKKWFMLARRDWRTISMKSKKYFCEDHFDLPFDMENYMRYKIQGYIQKIRMNDGCLPTKFACQPDRKRTAPNFDHSVVINRLKKALVDEVLKQVTDQESPECPQVTDEESLECPQGILKEVTDEESPECPQGILKEVTDEESPECLQGILKEVTDEESPECLQGILKEVTNEESPECLQGILKEVTDEESPECLQGILKEVTDEESPECLQGILKEMTNEESPECFQGILKEVTDEESPECPQGILKEVTDEESPECPQDSIQVEENIKEYISQATSLQEQRKLKHIKILRKIKVLNTGPPIDPYGKNIFSFRVNKRKPIILRTRQPVKSLLRSQVIKKSEPSLPVTEDKLPIIESQQSPESTSQASEMECDHEELDIYETTLKKIKRRSLFYIGIPENCYCLIDIIQKQTDIPERHILLCLKKIRLDTKFTELGDDFGMKWSCARKIFRKTVPVLANSLCSFITLAESTRKPIQGILFTHSQYSISCIIDSFEIEIQGPCDTGYNSVPGYEMANTIKLKYLISCTPDGLINFVSSGYSGRISNLQLMNKCNFLNSVSRQTDIKFKNLESSQHQNGFRLLTPSGEEITKEQVGDTIEIEHIRERIGRVVKRVREFAMLRLHTILNNYFLALVDEIVRIACALVNLQDSILQ
ncbi:unnamed protein product [Euphydryas editha]|uniref:THAP-type domain-containing protein n=1 Tax=Euphydryas editha TaxID=104508 RepID=A0AAU9UQR6_EUPED|nr:unnamed protein product [Euphydryas editha]